jgi:DNA-binding transcriptional regulator YhcF (GntR family)
LTGAFAGVSLFTYDTRERGLEGIVIEFHLDNRSGVPTYLQLVQQVRQAVRLGILRSGDQLPTVKEVVGALAINPNTVLKAYRELDHEGLTEGRRGQGTFVASTVPATPPDGIGPIRAALQRWLAQARAAGLDDEEIDALVAETVRTGSAKRRAA